MTWEIKLGMESKLGEEMAINSVNERYYSLFYPSPWYK